jgi:hypothetical protein
MQTSKAGVFVVWTYFVYSDMPPAENGEDEAVSEVLVATKCEEGRRHGSKL